MSAQNICFKISLALTLLLALNIQIVLFRQRYVHQITAMNYSEHYFSSFDGLKLCYRIYQPSSPSLQKRHTLLCLAGLSRDSHDFHDFACIMQDKNYCVIALDYRGRGKSDYDPQPKNYNVASYIEDVRHLLIVENLESVIVIGSSLGGIIGMFMGAAIPRVLAGVVLNDIGPEVDPDWIKKTISSLEKNHSFATWHEATAYTKHTFSFLTDLSEEQWLERTTRMFTEDQHARITRRFDVKILEPMRQRKKSPSYWSAIGSLTKVPLLLVRGDESDVLSRDMFLQMQQHLKEKDPAAPLQSIEISGQGHVPDLDTPHFINAFEHFYQNLILQ